MNMTISQAARDYVQKKILEENGIGFRLSIKKTGCSGYSYHPEIIHTISDQDVVVNLPNCIIYVDCQFSHLLDGIHIDYVEEIKSGLKQKKLVFLNPHETARCGCGESFHV